jgi:hypothetical protein
MERNPMSDPQYTSGNNYLDKKIKLLVADPDPGSGAFLNPEPKSGMDKFESWILGRHPSSATLL